MASKSLGACDQTGPQHKGPVWTGVVTKLKFSIHQ